MNIDDLKDLWQSQPANNSPMPESEIRQMLRGKATNLLDKFKRNIIVEGAISLLVLGLIFGNREKLFVFEYELEFMVLLTLFFIALYSFKYFQLTKFDLAASNLRHNLQLSLQAMNQYIKMYFYSSMLFVSAASLLPIWLLKKDLAPENTLSFWFIYLLVMGAVVGLFAWFMKWYIRKLYGKLRNELQNCLSELDEE
jgi:hypothetical protein